jgi:hypothetical protein
MPSLNAAILTFSSRAAFDAAHPALPIETFQAANIGAGGFSSFDAPLDSATNTSLFALGSILPGIQFLNSPSSATDGLILIGDGTVSGATESVGHNTFADILRFDLLPGVGAIGFDLFAASASGPPNSTTITVTTYGASGVLDTTVVSLEGIGFFGISSDAEAITRIEIDPEGTAQSGFVDNVAFGDTTGVPEPGTVLLLSTGIAAFLAFRRRARS